MWTLPYIYVWQTHRACESAADVAFAMGSKFYFCRHHIFQLIVLFISVYAYIYYME